MALLKWYSDRQKQKIIKEYLLLKFLHLMHETMHGVVISKGDKGFV